MVSAKGLVYQSTGTADLLKTLPQDQPLVVQLFGAEAFFLAEAVRLLREAGFGWFDLNVGCSVPKVLRQQAGAALLTQPDLLLDIARAMLHAAGPGRVGFKLRLGPDTAPSLFPDLALRLEDAGAGWLTLHPRTARQGFGGQARWDALPALAQRLSIPLLASGDLFTAADGVRCLHECGVTGVMYARGAMSNPAIFADHATLLAGNEIFLADPEHIRGMISRHIQLAQQYGAGRAAVWQMRSALPRYIRAIPGARFLRQELCQCMQWQDITETVDRFFDRAFSEKNANP